MQHSLQALEEIARRANHVTHAGIELCVNLHRIEGRLHQLVQTLCCNLRSQLPAEHDHKLHARMKVSGTAHPQYLSTPHTDGPERAPDEFNPAVVMIQAKRTSALRPLHQESLRHHHAECPVSKLWRARIGAQSAMNAARARSCPSIPVHMPTRAPSQIAVLWSKTSYQSDLQSQQQVIVLSHIKDACLAYETN